MPTLFYKGKMYSGGGGGSGTAYGGTDIPSSSLGTNGDYYYQYDSSGDVQIVYVNLLGVWHKIVGGNIIFGIVKEENALRVGHTADKTDIYAIGVDIVHT